MDQVLKVKEFKNMASKLQTNDNTDRNHAFLKKSQNASATKRFTDRSVTEGLTSSHKKPLINTRSGQKELKSVCVQKNSLIKHEILEEMMVGFIVQFLYQGVMEIISCINDSNCDPNQILGANEIKFSRRG